MTNDKPSKRKPPSRKIGSVERKIMEGAVVLKTVSADAARGVFWVFADTGRVARADVCERLTKAGKLVSRGDGLFGDGQTFGWAE